MNVFSTKTSIAACVAVFCVSGANSYPSFVVARRLRATAQMVNDEDAHVLQPSAAGGLLIDVWGPETAITVMDGSSENGSVTDLDLLTRTTSDLRTATCDTEAALHGDMETDLFNTLTLRSNDAIKSNAQQAAFRDLVGNDVGEITITRLEEWFKIWKVEDGLLKMRNDEDLLIDMTTPEEEAEANHRAKTLFAKIYPHSGTDRAIVDLVGFRLFCNTYVGNVKNKDDLLSKLYEMSASTGEWVDDFLSKLRHTGLLNKL